MAITTKATSNFSFRKLANALDDVLDGYFADSYEDVAQSARDIITSGKTLRKLKSRNEKERRDGTYGKNKKLPTGDMRPLHHTGKLLRSIKATKQGISVIGYAKHHIEGHSAGKTLIPPRNPFFTESENLRADAKKGAEKRMKRLIRNINKVWRTPQK